MSRAWLKVAGLTCALAMVGGAPALAGGFYSQEQSVRGLGGAHSGEAAGAGADLQWWNPAAVAGVESGEVYAGANGVFADADVRDGGSTIARPFAPVMAVGGSPASDPVGANLAPNLAGAWRLSPRLVLGVALNTPFGFITDVEPDSWTRYQAKQLRLLDVDIQPTLAFRAADWLDIGVGLDASYAETRLTTRLPNLSPLLADGESTVRGRGWNFGYVVGATVRPTSRVSLGVSYRSSITHRLSGQVTTSGLQGPLAVGNGIVPSVTRFTTPWILTAGVNWRAAQRWTLSAQVQRAGWSEFDTIQVDRPGGAPPPSRNARDTTSYAVGAEYAASERWTLRTGVQWDPQAIADSAMLADGDRFIVAAGASWRVSGHLTADVAAAYVRFKTSPIDSDATAYRGTALQTQITLLGEFSAKAPILGVGLRWRF